MILRVPEYYNEFECIADKCTDSCCRGWEVDVDEDSHFYYETIKGEFGDKIRRVTYENPEEEEGFGFTLTKDKRCPFLNDKNLCDMFIEIGEESLCDVCTNFPRFGMSYQSSNGIINQKFLSLACEEVGRILFSMKESVKFVDIDQPGGDWFEEDEEDIRICDFVEKVQWDAISILRDKSISIWDRMKKYLLFINDKHFELNEAVMADKFTEDVKREIKFDDYLDRLELIKDLETVAYNWDEERNSLLNDVKEENYESMINNFLSSEGYVELDYEQLMIYFTFRYMMNAIDDLDLISYGKLAIVFTLLVRDMDALRYARKGEYTRKDRIEITRIFSKEVEHAQENIDAAREAFLFDDVFKTDNLLKQI